MAGIPPESIAEATDKAIRASKELGAKHAGAVSAIRALARLLDRAMEDAEEGVRPDNTLFPTFLKYCDMLGFKVDVKPAAGKAEAAKKPADPLDKFKGFKIV
jgi:hypothetical protein